MAWHGMSVSEERKGTFMVVCRTVGGGGESGT